MPNAQTFELRISAPHELTVLQRLEDYRALRAANARFLGTVSQPVGPLEQEIMSGNRIYLQVGKKGSSARRRCSSGPHLASNRADGCAEPCRSLWD